MGKKTKIILGLAMGAMIPAMLTGCGHKHDYGTELKHNDTQHYYECSCGEKKDAEDHEASATYAHNDTHHWKDCVDCGYDLTIAQHTYDQEIAEEAYFKEETATDVIFCKSCVCGVASSEVTFSVAKTVGTLTNLSIANKTYDGIAISEPTYNTNSNGAVTIEYKVKGADDSTYTTTAPVNAGDYTVRVSIASNRVYTSVSETKDFTISKCEISGLEQDFVYNGESVQSVELPNAMNLPDNNVSMEITFASANVDSSPTGVRVLVSGVESENYEVNNCTANIVPKYLRFEDVYVKNYDGTRIVRFDFDDSSKDGIAATEGVYVEFEALEYDTPENFPLVNAGYYSQADCGPFKFYTSDNTETDNYTFDDNHFQGEWSGFKLWILDTNPLILEVDDRFHIEEDYILVSNIKQGSVKVGDSIVLPGTTDKVYEVLKIEKLHKEQGQATVGEEVGIYIDGMAEVSEVSRGDLLYTQGNIPELATTFFANIYAKTQAEGGRSTPFFDNYTPNIVGLAASQQVTIDIIDVYGKEDDDMVAPGDSALAKITLTNALPASLLENLEFTMMEGTKATVTGVGVDYVESQNFQNSMVTTDKFTTEAEQPIVVRLTNTRSETLDTLQFYVSNDSGGGNYLTDFTIKLYDSSFNLIEGTHDNTSGTFTKADTSKWSLAAKDTCYIVITTTSANVDVFAWLS